MILWAKRSEDGLSTALRAPRQANTSHPRHHPASDRRSAEPSLTLAAPISFPASPSTRDIPARPMQSAGPIPQPSNQLRLPESARHPSEQFAARDSSQQTSTSARRSVSRER